MQFEFSQAEMNDLIYAAREAAIRFKRARTEFRSGNKVYSQWNEKDLAERVAHYSKLEEKLVAQYESAFGEAW